MLTLLKKNPSGRRVMLEEEIDKARLFSDAASRRKSATAKMLIKISAVQSFLVFHAKNR